MSQRRKRASDETGVYATTGDIASLSSSLGMSPEQVKAMMASQGGGEIVQKAPPPTNAWNDFLKEESEEPKNVAKVKVVEVKEISLLEPPKGTPGVLVQTGTLDCSIPGRESASSSKKDAFPKVHLEGFHVLCRSSVFSKRKISVIAASSSSCHSVAIDTEGTAYVWGRNECSQLGFPSPKNVVVPRVVEGFGNKKIVAAAVGKSHTTVIDDEGTAWSCGLNKLGQCGVNNAIESVPIWRKAIAHQSLEIYSCYIIYSISHLRQ